MVFGRKKREPQEENEEKLTREALLGALGIRRWRVPEGYRELESYPLMPPFSYAVIAQNEKTSHRTSRSRRPSLSYGRSSSMSLRPRGRGRA